MEEQILLRQVSKASPNLDDLDLNPLFVQADPGNNKRYCENQEINMYQILLIKKFGLRLEKALDNQKIDKDYNIKILIELLEQEFLIIYIKNMDMKN